ncbi:MAG: MBL fold metallo-hydrolase [Candidatus Methanoperedens sp.]|nr:MBL fold metallo-hydrolase [Candidatus Methanoperedens sp.]
MTNIKKKLMYALSVLALVTLITFPRTQSVPGSSIAPAFKEGENSITFIGHSTVLIHLNGTNILTDPNFNNWAVIVHRGREPGIKIENLPKIGAILISHAHRDHLDKWTMEQLPKDTPVLISEGNGAILRDWGFTDVREMNVWNKTEVNGIKITAAPAKHSGARNSASADFPKALGYIVQGDKTVYFAGDTGLFDGLKEIGNYSQIDAALLPIGAYSPRWFMKSHHMNPDDAIQAMAMLGAKEMIPIHWGSFRMAYDGINEPKDMLLKLVENSSLKEIIHVLDNGEKYLLP